MSYNKKEGTKFHELVTRVSVSNKQENTNRFKDILDWVKSNRYLRIIQRKDNNG